MLSATHAALVDVLGAHPEALSYLLQLQGHAVSRALRPTSGTWSKIVRLERRVDRAFVEGARKAPEGFVLAEVQLAPDDDKLRAWPLYLELGRTRFGCEGALVVVTVSEEVRAWIRARVEQPTGRHGTERRLRPTVVALDELGREALLRADRPYLAALAVAGHARGEDAQAVAEAALEVTLSRLPPVLAVAQIDAILGMVDEALRAHLESGMKRRHVWQSELFRKPYREGLAEGEARGKAEGLAEGKAEGKAEGVAAGEAQAVLAVLEARGIPVSETIRAQVLGCTDVATLDVWVRRAAVASTAAAVVRARAPRTKAGKAPAAKRTSTKASRARA